MHLKDDLDGGPAHDTIQINLDGKGYEIDLYTAHAEKLREALRFLAKAGLKTTRTRASGSDPNTTKIRTWAKENGHEDADRGRIDQILKDTYCAAHRVGSISGDKRCTVDGPHRGGDRPPSCVWWTAPAPRAQP
ncbi:histone-like nucleoid-structuring protein Lsr2 [Kocuria sp. U4B]